VTALGLAARAELDLKEPRRARELATRAAAAQPDAEYPLRLLALSLHALGRFADACEAAQAAVANAPNVWQTHYTLAYVSAGTPGMDSVARDAARRAVELAPLEAENPRRDGPGRRGAGRPNDCRERAARGAAAQPEPRHGAQRSRPPAPAAQGPLRAAGHFAHAAADDVRMEVAQHNSTPRSRWPWGGSSSGCASRCSYSAGSP